MRTHRLFVAIFALAAAFSWGCHTEPEIKSDQPTAPSKADRFAGMSANAFDSVRLQTQRIPGLGVSIAIPVGWSFTHRVEKKQDVWLIKSPCSDSIKFCTNYVLNATPRQKELPIKNYGDFFIMSLRNRYDTFTLINRSEENINGVPSTTIDYINREQGLDLGGTATLYFLDKIVVVVNFGALNQPKGDYVRHRGLYTRILATLRPLKN